MTRARVRPGAVERWDAPATGHYRIFLAEDDEAVRRLLAASLRLDGHDVRTFEDGLRLFSWLSASMAHGIPPDLVLTDLEMPHVDGIELLRRMSPFRPRVPVILMSGRLDGAVRATAAALGADAVFAKPFDLDDLRTAVIHVVDRARRIQAP